MDENQFKLFTAGVLRRHGSKQPLGEMKHLLDGLAWSAIRQWCCYKHAAADINNFDAITIVLWIQDCVIMYKGCNDDSSTAKFIQNVTQQCLDKGMKMNAAFSTAYKLGLEFYQRGVNFDSVKAYAVDLDTDEGKAIIERVSMGKEPLQ